MPDLQAYTWGTWPVSAAMFAQAWEHTGAGMLFRQTEAVRLATQARSQEATQVQCQGMSVSAPEMPRERHGLPFQNKMLLAREGERGR